MAIYKQVAVSGSAASSDWIVLSQYQTPFNTGIAVDITGTGRYTVHGTLANVGMLGTAAAVSASSRFEIAGLASSTTSNTTALSIPAAAIKITLVSASAGTDFAIMRVIQQGY